MPENVQITIGGGEKPRPTLFQRLLGLIFWLFVAAMIGFFFIAWDENYRKLERDGTTDDAGLWWQENGPDHVRP